MRYQVDYCVFGGGMVGAACAIGLAKLGHKVVVIEPNRPDAFDPKSTPDLRVSALNRYTQSLLSSFGVWDDVLAMRAKQYSRLSVWEDISKALHFKADEIGEQYLGYFVENRILQLALLNKLKDEYADNVTVLYQSPERIKLNDSEEGGLISLDDGSDVVADVFVAADGGFSQLRSAVNIGTTAWQYQQNANVLLVKMLTEFEAATWQQFTPKGPIAFLPLFDNYASLVWYGDNELSETLKKASNSECKAKVQAIFPKVLGDFEVIDKTAFPLRRMHANQYWRKNVVLVGDAAHQINPLAGQGVNLGFKDVGALIESIKNNPVSLTNKQAFIDYERSRRGPNLAMMTAMDVFYQTFSNDILPLKLLRNMGVQIADNAGPVKHKVLKYAMGME
ncbi:FAD-dependent monooxygenase [Alteromonas sp. W364]|uniref:FAD-dependent monooxygenase n=1 Tax=Alteromonas sp. W364 TaxID=3075610 RepID=UPI0028845991|nr:FAD-dependent monooxygenase [Alteromonas sp. W364]MDT0628453.1 FAD-dependent monooxygenase [Alteromonas sp. W364]